MSKAEPVAPPGDGPNEIPVEMLSFQRLADLWQLSTEDQVRLLGSPGRSTYFKWKKDGGNLPRDTEERVSHLLAIFKALEILLPDIRAADGWLRRPNQYFQGQSALDVMLNGQMADIITVRQYVDAQRG